MWHEDSEEREIPSLGLNTLSMQKNVNPWFLCCMEASLFGFKLILDSKIKNVFRQGECLAFKVTSYNLTLMDIVKPLKISLVRVRVVSLLVFCCQP